MKRLVVAVGAGPLRAVAIVVVLVIAAVNLIGLMLYGYLIAIGSDPRVKGGPLTLVMVIGIEIASVKAIGALLHRARAAA